MVYGLYTDDAIWEMLSQRLEREVAYFMQLAEAGGFKAYPPPIETAPDWLQASFKEVVLAFKTNMPVVPITVEHGERIDTVIVTLGWQLLAAFDKEGTRLNDDTSKELQAMIKSITPKEPMPVLAPKGPAS